MSHNGCFSHKKESKAQAREHNLRNFLENCLTLFLCNRPLYFFLGGGFGFMFYSEFQAESADGDFEVVPSMFWMTLQLKGCSSEHWHCPNIG